MPGRSQKKQPYQRPDFTPPRSAPRRRSDGLLCHRRIHHRAIVQAKQYDQSAFEAYPAAFASRRNYDVIAGTDFRGLRRSGVLEQSWRIGGSSGAEIAAFEAFTREPKLAHVRSSTVEIFGESSPPPVHATVYYRGTDPVAGLVTKYATILP
ncbi:MAG: DUF3182 family protein [Tardiphaga sp.]|nr:DUF3182 family protein [Tardiphaga sp.]